ncbi:hypothetical protein [Methylomonas albis]|uniref:PEP-CTERM protein-sorting domain-containing protein n=1 Tax=Methylomonas albis TaxID=1854563 RepID=A0ABR9CZ07_9GAMM|nr:hypothetical protein [Methylomonas albis]MBD9355208.1 hypothetical protein [Methylomonas albis]
MKFISVMSVRYITMVSILFAGMHDATASTATAGDYLTSQNYIIDAANSTVTYNPGTLSFDSSGAGGFSPSVTHNVSGTFTLNFNHFSWSNPSDWAQISNAVIIANGLPAEFNLPRFYSELTTPIQFSGSDTPCAGPKTADTYCSGFQNGPSSTLSGQIQDGKITLSGYQPNATYYWGGGYTYSIVATVVPAPAAFWLFASALGFFGILKRTKR